MGISALMATVISCSKADQGSGIPVIMSGSSLIRLGEIVEAAKVTGSLGGRIRRGDELRRDRRGGAESRIV